jgi:hypothetical protein
MMIIIIAIRFQSSSATKTLGLPPSSCHWLRKYKKLPVKAASVLTANPVGCHSVQ